MSQKMQYLNLAKFASQRIWKLLLMKIFQLMPDTRAVLLSKLGIDIRPTSTPLSC